MFLILIFFMSDIKFKYFLLDKIALLILHLHFSFASSKKTMKKLKHVCCDYKIRRTYNNDILQTTEQETNILYR